MLQKKQLDEAIWKTCMGILAHQAVDGRFVYCCEVAPISDAIMVIFLNLIGKASDPLIPELCHLLIHKQKPDGSFTVYPNQKENVSATTLVYFALLLSGVQKSSSPMLKARSYILRHGGITQCSWFAKVFLAVAGQISWRSLPNLPMEIMMRHSLSPVSLWDITSPMRVHVPSMLLLSHLNFSYRIPDSVSLKDLVLDEKWHKGQVQMPNQHAIQECRKFLIERMEPNGTIAGYLSATVLAVFALHAIGYSYSHRVIQQSIVGLKTMVCRLHSFVHQQFFTSTIWDTALSMHALHAASLPSLSRPLMRGASYLVSRQHWRMSDWRHHTPSGKPGGWGFSDINTWYPDVDDTAVVLEALGPFSHIYRTEWRKGLRFLLSMQNSDGGWSAFDRDCDNKLLGFLFGEDIGKLLTDPSTPDITGRVLDTIVKIPGVPQEPVSRAVNWLLEHQQSDGSWFGRWGICFIYGTCLAVQGLRASGVSRNHAAISKALSWLLGVQNPDGGFGESCASDDERKYISLGKSTPTQTAWALITMLHASGSKFGAHKVPPLNQSRGSNSVSKSIERAASYLINTVNLYGGWSETYPTGAGITGEAYIRYHSYPYVWPLMALSLYRDLYLTAKNKY